MSQSTCPHCGKPVRPGSKFCGHCGNTISAAPAPTPESAAGATCPHCQQPVRPGAKFCSHCGRSIEVESPAPVQPPAAAPGTPQAPPEPGIQPAAITRKATPKPAASDAEAISAPTQPEARPPKPSPTPQPPGSPPPASVLPPPKRKYRLLPWLIIILIVVCLAAGGGLFYFFDPLDMFGEPTATATATWTATPTQAAATSEPPAPTDTPQPTFTPPALPTNTPLLPTEEIPPTAELPENTTQPIDIGNGEFLLDEQFDGIITTNWLPWGNSADRTSIKKGFDNSASLNAEDPANAGITSKDEFAFVQNSEIIFSARLQEIFETFHIVFNLDPVQKTRSEGDNDLGLLQFEIYKDKIILISSVADEKCEQPLAGADAHIYRFVFSESNSISLFIDNAGIPICENLATEIDVARITFRGLGYISSIKVAAP